MMEFKLRSAVLPLIIANVVIFILQNIIPGLTDNFILVGGDQFSRPWILLTSMFLHADIMHILFNMYALFLFGPLLESKIGPKKFLIVYFASGLFAAFITSFIYSAALGASAAIMGVIGALIILWPELPLLFFFVIPTPLWMAGIIFAAIDVFGVFYPSGVGNLAHLIGLAFGLLCGYYLRKNAKKKVKDFGKKDHLSLDEAEELMRSGRI